MMFPAVLCIGFASAQETDEKPGEESLLRFIEIGGVAEFTVSRKQSSEGETSTSTAAEQLEMGVGIEPHPWIGSEFGWIHEHEEDHGEEEEGHELGIFTGTIIVGPPDGNWWLKGGVQFLPFTMFELAEVHAAHDASIGPFETGAIVDPLSFEFGSKREKSLLLGVSLGEFLGSVYGYYGDDARSDEPRSGFGAAVGYKKHVDEEDEIAFNLSYIDDLGTLAGFQEEVFGHESEEHGDHGADHSGPPAGAMSGARMVGGYGHTLQRCCILRRVHDLPGSIRSRRAGVRWPGRPSGGLVAGGRLWIRTGGKGRRIHAGVPGHLRGGGTRHTVDSLPVRSHRRLMEGHALQHV